MPQNKLPCFFFSYARRDLQNDRFLRSFFDELKKEVELNSDRSAENDEISFRDLDDIHGGDDWEYKLISAASECLTMVSIYSPTYFGREVCGKEFQLFLDRQNVEISADGVARGSKKIVPVLWVKQKNIEEHRPPIVAKINDFLPSKDAHQRKYLENGLKMIRRTGGRNGGVYVQILSELADRLIHLAEKDPLPRSNTEISLDEVPNAFEKTLQYSQADVSNLNSKTPLFIYLTASGLEGVPLDWRPFDCLETRALHLEAREIASSPGIGFDGVVEPGHNLAHDDVAEKILEDLRKATARNALAVLFVDPRFAADERGSKTLAAILEDDQWNGGLIAVVDANDAETVKVASQHQSKWAVDRPQQQRIVVRTVIGTPDDFRQTFQKVLVELQKYLTLEGKVEQPFEGEGRSATPQLRSPAGRRADG